MVPMSYGNTRMARNRFGFCSSSRHAVSRRQFLGALGTGLLAGPTLCADNVVMESPQAADLKKQRKAVIILYLGGGASQLETWDPKPGAPTGGPYVLASLRNVYGDANSIYRLADFLAVGGFSTVV